MVSPYQQGRLQYVGKADKIWQALRAYLPHSNMVSVHVSSIDATSVELVLCSMQISALFCIGVSFFYNPILFEICTNTVDTLCRNLCCGMQNNAQ
jgi:hypothetical protein